MGNLTFKKGDVIHFNYTNYKGERSHRRAVVRKIYEGSTEWHPEYQWLIEAFDINKNAMRTFAYRDMANIVNTGIKGKKMSDYFDPDDPFRQPDIFDE